MGIMLGVDYGDKRIGLALSDPEEKLARRFLTLINNGKTDEVISKMGDIIEKENVVKIIMGIPIGLSGASDQTHKVEKFLELLQIKINIPVDTINEVFTSKMAEDNLRSAGIKDIKAVLDQEAARIILQDYLDRALK